MSETPSYTPPPPPPPPPPAGGSSPAGSDRTLMLVLSYLGIFALIPLLTKKEDKEVQWHAKNGLALAVAWVLIWVIFFILGMVLRGVLAPIGCGLGVIECVVACGLLVVDIVAMVKAINGQRMRIPLVTDMSEKM